MQATEIENQFTVFRLAFDPFPYVLLFTQGRLGVERHLDQATELIQIELTGEGNCRLKHVQSVRITRQSRVKPRIVEHHAECDHENRREHIGDCLPADQVDQHTDSYQHNPHERQ